MKTRRKYDEEDDNPTDERTMTPLPEDSPLSSPRTRSPAKGVRSEPASMSMLTMLAEVASVTLHTDPSVTDVANTILKSKTSPPVNRKHSDFEVLTLEQVSGMTDNSLIKLFAEFESNEMWKRFTYTCMMLPAACSKYFQSFGSENKARSSMKAHLQSHLKSLLEVNTNKESRLKYILESIPARKRRLTEPEVIVKKRTVSHGNRNSKANVTPKVTNQEGSSKTKKPTNDTPKETRIEMQVESHVFQAVSKLPESNLKRKLENKDGKTKAKKPKQTDAQTFPCVDDCNNNNNNNDVKNAVKVVFEPSCNPPMQEIVSHDHGYLKASTSVKPDTVGSNTPIIQGASVASSSEPSHPPIKTSQYQNMTIGAEGTIESCVDVCGKENPPDDVQNTLLHQHMNQEVEGEIMAQDCGSDATPLPLVGSEVEFTPEQQYKVMRSADLPVVYNHNDPLNNVQPVSRIIERDEYKVRKKPKGRAKFIGQSKAEKEMALKMITEIRSQAVMNMDTLECKICHPPRLFTALSTLLSHYRSHAGIRPYECRICDAVFTRQHSLNYHMLIHTNQTRFTCIDCGRKFRHPSHFKEHRRRHTGESPYECSDCQMRFKTRNTYKRHLRTRHGKLLTTQGAIIILSQEEADRMKKTQGRKPRRPRQPLQIISPETAAQIEEEQIWTDFEEGDREEEEEDYEELEEGEGGSEGPPSPLDLTKKPVRRKASRRSDPLTKILPAQFTSNGKTGHLTGPTKVSVGKSDLSTHVGILTDVNGKPFKNRKENVVFKEEIKEEALTESINDFSNYVFQPTAQHGSVPKVNVKSTWNTINVDVKTEPNNSVTMPNLVYSDASIVSEPDRIVSMPSTGHPEFVGDNFNPEEVITICAGVDHGGKDVVLSPLVESHTTPLVESHATPNTGVKTDCFTVKKPLKCYSRTGYNQGDTTNNLLPGATLTNQIDSHPQGVYFIVQGQDGRLAKLYQGSPGSVVTSSVPLSHSGVQVRTQSKPVFSNGSPYPLTSKGSWNDTGKPNAEFVNSKSVSSLAAPTSRVIFKPLKALNNRNVALNSTMSDHNKVVVNKQVVSNVVLKNHIVQNGNLVKVRCEERDLPLHPVRSSSPLVSVVPITNTQKPSPKVYTSIPRHKIPDSPSVIVTSVASVSNTTDALSKVIVTSVIPNPSHGGTESITPSPMQSSFTQAEMFRSQIPANNLSKEALHKSNQNTKITTDWQETSPVVVTENTNRNITTSLIQNATFSKEWQGISPVVVTGNTNVNQATSLKHVTEHSNGIPATSLTHITEDEIVEQNPLGYTTVEQNPLGYTTVKQNPLRYREGDAMVTIDKSLCHSEIIANLANDTSMTVNGIVEEDGIVKFDQQLNGAVQVLGEECVANGNIGEVNEGSIIQYDQSTLEHVQDTTGERDGCGLQSSQSLSNAETKMGSTPFSHAINTTITIPSSAALTI